MSTALMLVLASGCSDSSDDDATTGGPGDACAADVDVSGCDVVLAPGDDDTTHVQSALIEAKSQSTVCFCPGTFAIDAQLSLTVPGVTVRGAGANIGDTVLDFAGSVAGMTGNDTMLVTADDFTIENLTIQNTPGNGVVVRQADHPTFRKLHVLWEGEDESKHGAYAIYPAECTNVLIEDSEVHGAADAAIYVGQGTGALVRNNKAYDSVLGIEFENTTDGEAYGNDVYNNAGGFAVFLLPNLNKKDSERILVHDNDIHDNNHPNFGDPKTVVAAVPPGTGVLVIAADDVEFRDNTIRNNESAGVLVVSHLLLTALVPGTKLDANTDGFSQRTFIHGNTYEQNGLAPHGDLNVIGVTPLENVLWDGITSSGAAEDNTDQFCLGASGPFPTFRMFAGFDIGNLAAQSTDTTPYECALPPLPSRPEPSR